ncbi:MAG: tyrosine-type recombinase/integrase [Candidatus Woesearchaeota archaeon]
MTVDVLYNMKREMLRRKMSRKTISTYLQYVRQFLEFCKDNDVRQFSKRDVRAFLISLQEKGVAGSTLNVAHNALRFLMIDILHKSMYLKLKFAKTPKRAPAHLSKEQVAAILRAIVNPKHWLLVALMYGAGLRVSEVVSLKASDLDFDRSIGRVRHGKGDKERPFIIPDILIGELKTAFVKEMRSGCFLVGKDIYQ